MQLLDEELHVSQELPTISIFQSKNPQKISDLMKVAGFSLKSSVLILQTLQNQNLMVAVDRHLQRSLKSLGWVHPLSTSETETSLMVTLWLPKEEYANINNVIAGICQLLQLNATKNHVLRLSIENNVHNLVSKMIFKKQKK